VGWDWLGVLVLAPLSGVSQELYFRSSLLPALLHVCGHRAALALALHGVLFALWHLRTLVLMSLPVAALTALVLLLAGLGWGWQTLRDQTVVWAMGQHTIFLMAMAFFGFG
jgi:membrane protease YdiL (CAAX protease family)